MSRHRKYEAEPESDPQLDISSLIDVCFLLLIYFIVTSTISPKETDIGMALPSASPSTNDQPDLDPKFIEIDSAGAIYTGTGGGRIPMDSDTGDRKVPLLTQDLEVYASAAKGAGSKPVVQIYADGGASYQRVIDVLNALAGVNIQSVTFTDLVD